MARRPAGVDRDEWLRERREVWRRRNRVFNILMLLAVAAVLFRYLWF